MSITRRNFLREGTLVGLSTVATLSLANLTFGQLTEAKKSGLTAVPLEAYNTTLDKLSRDMFASVVYSTFIINHPTAGRIETYLKSVEDFTPPIFKQVAKKGVECFNLVFACQSSVEFTQGTYTIEHEKFGRFELFIVPGTRQRYGRDYGAVINRLYP
jgi:hypothetical protein